MYSLTTHDFYLGRGPDAEWIGSAHLGTNFCYGLDHVLRASTAAEFTAGVDYVLRAVEADKAGEVTHRGGEWPWPWPTSHGTDYSHAFDTDAVWTARLGDRWAVRAGKYLSPGPGEIPVVFRPGRGTCGYTGIHAADTVSRRYGPLLGETYRHDLSQLGLRILTDLTQPPGPGAPDELIALRGYLPPHLRYYVTADESAVELEFEVFGYREGDSAADTARQALAWLPILYGWSDPAGGPPRFGVRVLIADEDRHRDRMFADHHIRAVLATH